MKKSKRLWAVTAYMFLFLLSFGFYLMIAEQINDGIIESNDYFMGAIVALAVVCYPVLKKVKKRRSST